MEVLKDSDLTLCKKYFIFTQINFEKKKYCFKVITFKIYQILTFKWDRFFEHTLKIKDIESPISKMKRTKAKLFQEATFFIIIFTYLK